MKFVALPTWLLVRATIPFLPKDHRWRGERFTLAEWRATETPLSRQFDWNLWLSSGCAIYVILILALR